MKRFLVRFPDELHAELQTAASGSMRSLHAEILLRLQESLEADDISGLPPEPKVDPVVEVLRERVAQVPSGMTLKRFQTDFKKRQ